METNYLYFDFGMCIVRCLILWKFPIVKFSIVMSIFNLILCVESTSFVAFVVLKDGQAERTLWDNLEGRFTVNPLPGYVPALVLQDVDKCGESCCAAYVRKSSSKLEIVPNCCPIFQ